MISKNEVPCVDCHLQAECQRLYGNSIIPPCACGTTKQTTNTASVSEILTEVANLICDRDNGKLSYGELVSSIENFLNSKLLHT